MSPLEEHRAGTLLPYTYEHGTPLPSYTLCEPTATTTPTYYTLFDSSHPSIDVLARHKQANQQRLKEVAPGS